jgi:hypothetical protein
MHKNDHHGKFHRKKLSFSYHFDMPKDLVCINALHERKEHKQKKQQERKSIQETKKIEIRHQLQVFFVLVILSQFYR